MESKWQSFLLTILLDTLTLILSLILVSLSSSLSNFLPIKYQKRNPRFTLDYFLPLYFSLSFFDTFFSNTDHSWFRFLSLNIYPLNFHPSLDNERGEKERKRRKENEGRKRIMNVANDDKRRKNAKSNKSVNVFESLFSPSPWSVVSR